MATPYMSEIRIFSFNFAPRGWAQCNGQILPINQNQALFSILGTTYGGNGQTTFALPNLQGRVAIHTGNQHVLGVKGGEEVHTLTTDELASHTHLVNATSLAANLATPTASSLWASGVSEAAYSSLATNGVNMGGTATNDQLMSSTGGSQSHSNMQPFLVVTYCIALQGIFPSPN